jgi:hypothetical protein
MTAPGRRPCANPGCWRDARPYDGRGRPPLYCSTRCRQAAANRPNRGALTIELTHKPLPPRQRPAGRVWTVRIRRGGATVTIATDLGHTSADALATNLAALLDAPVTTPGGAID